MQICRYTLQVIFTLQVLFLQSDLQFTFQKFPFIITDCCHTTWDSACPEININIWILLTTFLHTCKAKEYDALYTQQAQLCLHILVVNLYILWKLLWKDIEVDHIKTNLKTNKMQSTLGSTTSVVVPPTPFHVKSTQKNPFLTLT